MLLDAYSLCPAGTGKRIKFCCKDLLPDLQEIDRMVEGEQYVACLNRIEQAERKAPDRACLLALKCQLLLEMKRFDDHEAAAKRFVEKHPNNPAAWAGQAIVAADDYDQDSRAVMTTLQQAIELAGKEPSCQSVKEFPLQLYDAMGIVARRLFADGEFPPAMALWIAQSAMQVAMRRGDMQPINMLIQLHTTTTIPLQIKDSPLPLPCPDDVPWKAEYDVISQAISVIRWQRAANLLTALVSRVSDVPMLWRNLAVLRGWLCDTEGCIEAWRKYTTMDIPLEDASEAEALAMFLSDDPLGDLEEIQKFTYEIGDAEAVQAAIAASPRVIPAQPKMSDDAPPPKATFLLLDRLPLTAENIATTTVEQVPCTVACVLLYGPETGSSGEPDRVARIELVVTVNRLTEEAQAWLGDLVAETRDVVPTMKIESCQSASSQLLRCRWFLPSNLPSKPVTRLKNQFIGHALLHQWTAMPLGLFEGKSPREAAADPAQHVKLMAAILVLEHWTEQADEVFDFNLLRSELGLPILGPIDPRQTDVMKLPLVRLSRVEVEKLDDETLPNAYRRVWGFRVGTALDKFARAMVARPYLPHPYEMNSAYGYLAATVEDTTQALDYIASGRKVSAETGESCVTWDFSEMRVRVQRGENQAFMQLVEHVKDQHIHEPGVKEELWGLLMDLGLMRPDGTLAVPHPAVQEEPPIVVPGATAGETGKLRTSDSADPGGQKSNIWTPE